jgi:hypothetical protein
MAFNGAALALRERECRVAESTAIKLSDVGPTVDVGVRAGNQEISRECLYTADKQAWQPAGARCTAQ